MSRDEFAFVRYLKRCKELHEQWHPGAKYDEEEFKKFASKKWNNASKLDKDKFRHPFQRVLLYYTSLYIPIHPYTSSLKPYKTSF